MWIVAWNTKRYSCHRLKADGCREEIFCSFWLVLTQVCCNFLHYSIVGSKLETLRWESTSRTSFFHEFRLCQPAKYGKVIINSSLLGAAVSVCLQHLDTNWRIKQDICCFWKNKNWGGEGALRSPLLKYLKWIVLSQKVRRRRRCSPVKQLFDLCCFLVGIVPVELFVSWNYSNLVLEIAVGFQKEVQDADLDSLTTMPVDFRWLISKVTCGMFSTRVTAGGVPMTY